MKNLSYKIDVKDRRFLSGVVHGSVWRQGAFRWEPEAFVVESPRLENKIVEAAVQVDSFESFKAEPNRPMVYVISGNPDDSKAKYFAAYLAYLHKCKYEHRADVHWEPVYGGFDNPLIKKEVEPTMLILSNLAENSTNAKIEKARDLLERFPNIPRIVVCVGEDPISFASTKLYCPAHGIAYFSNSLVKAVQTII
jgi:hypothetical protein